MLAERVSVVIVTRNREAALRRTLRELAALPDPPPVMVVDDASTYRTREVVSRAPGDVALIERDRQEGPVARNHGVRRAGTPYVALSDDDSWWAPGALERAAALLDGHPRLAAVTARILMGDKQRTDPICDEMAHSPVRGNPSVPGIPILSFMGGATVLRRCAFEQAGGFEPQLIGGGEEEPLACDLVALGWELRYASEVVAYHHPAGGDKSVDRVLGIRNALWFAWRRRPLPSAVRWTVYMMQAVPWSARSVRAFGEALRGLPWVFRTRRVVPPRVERELRALDRQKMKSSARRYG